MADFRESHAASARALGAQFYQKVATTLPHDSAFIKAIRDRLVQGGFQGTVTAVKRDASGLNSVFIKRTGMTVADANAYPVFDAKAMPIVGDLVYLEYVGGHGPTAQVTGAAKGGRPNDVDIAWAGGQITYYDSGGGNPANRKAIHAKQDSHNQVAFDTDGATMAFMWTHDGHHKSRGDLYFGATLDSQGNPSGSYGRATINLGVYQQRLGVSGSEQILLEHNNSTFNIRTTGTIRMQAAASANNNGGLVNIVSADNTTFHVLGDDGANNFYAQHKSGTQFLVHSGTSIALRATSANIAFQHTDTTAITYTTGTARHKVGAGPGGNGASISFVSSDNLTFHALGDDGTGSVQVTHKNGTKILVHTGSQITLRASGANLAFTHNDTTAITYTSGTARKKVGAANGGNGGLISVTSSDNLSFHNLGDDGTGNFQATHKSGTQFLVHSGTSIALRATSANIAFQHTDTTAITYTAGTARHKVGAGPGGNGSTISFSSSDNLSFHALGDDGTGNLQATHKSGTNFLVHTGTQLTMRASGTNAAFIHTDTNFKVYTGGTQRHLTGTTGNGGQVGIYVQDNINVHIMGEDGAGNLVLQGYNATTLIKVSNGASAHQFQSDRHALPTGAKHKSPTSDRIDTLNPGETAGAIKSASHNATTAVFGVNMPLSSVTPAAGTSPDPFTYGGATGYSDYHLKMFSAIVFDTQNNGQYGVNYALASINAGLGGPCWTGNPATQSATAFWACAFNNASASMKIVVQTTSGTYSGTIGWYFQYINS